MKNTFILVNIILLFSSVFMPSTAQTVEYNYDNSGNITSRKVIVFASLLSTQDSITAPWVFEDTQINVRLYPDYALRQLKVEVPDHKDNEFLIFRLCDMDGRLLSSAKSYEASNKLDIGRFANEACTLNISRNGKSSSWHIILL